MTSAGGAPISLHRMRMPRLPQSTMRSTSKCLACPSIRFPDGARFIRVTGTDLDEIAQNMYDLENKTVKLASPMAHAR